MTDAIRSEYTLIMARLGEVWLKGKNRRHFLHRLRRNLQTTLSAELKGCQVQPTHGRFFIQLTDPATLQRALEICISTPGLASVSPVRAAETNLEAIKAAASEMAAADWGDAQGTFGVAVSRAWKRFPVSSTQMGAVLGGCVLEQTELSVNLSKPDYRMGVKITEKRTLLWTHNFKCAGGLPVGSTGRVLLLLSGGIDSPVAGHLAQKRGCEIEALYFHSPPFISERSRDKVETLAQKLAPKQGGLSLHVCHFTEIQKAIKAHCDPRLTVLLYRRFMYRIADVWARKRKIEALCTGENLGQVASQTLPNLRLVDSVTDQLTLRPLMMYDKVEIMAIARQIGTYDTSILPFQDCCTLFVPDNPATSSTPKVLEREEARLDVVALVAQAVAQIESKRL